VLDDSTLAMRTKRHTQRKQHLLLQLSSVSHSLVQGKAGHFMENDAANRFPIADFLIS
jgi:hypothetical protein